MVQLRENLNVCLGVQPFEVFCLRSAGKSLLCAVPIVDIGARDSLQSVCIYRLIALAHRTTSASRVDLAALIEQHIEIVRVEHPAPKVVVVKATPHIGTLQVSERSYEPALYYQFIT